MAIVQHIACEICKGILSPENEDCISVVGNINTVNPKDSYGVGGGLFGDGKWL